MNIKVDIKLGDYESEECSECGNESSHFVAKFAREFECTSPGDVLEDFADKELVRQFKNELSEIKREIKREQLV